MRRLTAGGVLFLSELVALLVSTARREALLSDDDVISTRLHPDVPAS